MARQSSLPVLSSPVRKCATLVAGVGLALTCTYTCSQAITVSTKSGGAEIIDRRYSQIQSTSVKLPDNQIDARGHQDILRSLVAEQGFAMRPLPRGKKGLSLEANGKLKPAGEAYLSQVTEQGLSVKPGDRVVLSNIRIERDRIVFDINGGPEHKHEFLRHVQIGMGGGGRTNPVLQDDNQQPAGSRITLVFPKYTPDVTPAQIKALLAPLISFDMKTPVQAYTDTLPPKLKEAILNHHVMVGMSTDMVLFALGPPESKSREVEGQMPFEEWIYGHPPQDVNFVRVNGNRVIRVEVAKLGQPLEVFTKDEVEGLLLTDGRPVLAEAGQKDTKTVQLGDVHRNPDTQAPVAPPTLRGPGEKLPQDDPNQRDPAMGREGPMKPVIFPKDTTNDPAHTTQARPENKTGEAAKPDAEQAVDLNAPDPEDLKPEPDAKPDPKPDTKPAPEPAKPATPPNTNFYPSKS
jgi:hypothetical protein